MKTAGRIVLPALVLAIVAIGSQQSVSPGRGKVIYVSTAGPQYTVEELSARATIVALVRTIDGGAVHWNNEENTEWSPSPNSGKAALIVRDSQAVVLKSFRGNMSELSFRTVGGVAAGVEMVFDNGPHLTQGGAYIVFLEDVAWPSQEGSERVFAPIGEGQGIFALSDAGLYENSAGLQLSDSLDLGSEG